MNELMSVEEIIDLAGQDLLFYGQHYFPKTVRQNSPAFHIDIAEILESGLFEKIAAKVFRGGAKTSLARILVSKRIAFGISRTILVISETAEHSYETVKWIKRAVERRDHWAKDFKLYKGDKYKNPETDERYTWRDDKIQIINESFLDEHTGLPLVITIVGTGIFGQSRGLNIEDYRPDFILLDDVQDEDNAKTEEQRLKVNERIYGAISNTLAPRSESPLACMLMLQTPLHPLDTIETAKKDPDWKYIEISCFDENGQSRWPDRWTTEELLKKKQGFIARNQLNLWLREMEVKVMSGALSLFVSDWVNDNSYDHFEEVPEDSVYYLGVDPTPPPADSKQKSSTELAKLDDSALIVIACWRAHVWVVDIYTCKSPLPNELINQIFFMARRWKVRAIGFESVLFARTTKWLIEEEMRKTRSYYRLEAVEDKRKKSVRIRDGLTDIAFNGQLHVRKDQVDLISQFIEYPDVEHDDLLDALTIALMCRNGADIIEGDYEVVSEDDLAAIEDWRGCVGLRG